MEGKIALEEHFALEETLQDKLYRGLVRGGVG